MIREPYVVGWTVPTPWWEWAGLYTMTAILWPLALTVAGLERAGRALADWIESP